MGFSYNKAMALRPQKEKWLSTFFFALLISAAVLIPYVISEIEFFSDAARRGIGQLGAFFLHPEDLDAYYFPLFGTLGMVIGNPVALLSGLIPEVALPYVCAGVMALRISFSALTAYIFIRRFTRTPAAARLGAFLYAFSSAVMGITVNNAYQNAVIVFPLVLLAAEILLTENRRLLLALAVFCAAIISGYAIFGILIYLVIYLVIRMTSRDTRVDFLRVFALFFEIFMGALAVAILLIPMAVVSVCSAFSYTDFIGIGALFNQSGEVYLSLLASFLLPAESVNSAVISSGGVVGAYLPLMSVAGVIAFCTAKKYSSFKRIVIVSIVLQVIPALGRIFSILNPAVGYTWFYMPTLIFALVTVMAVENREVKTAPGVKWAAFLTIITSGIIAVFPKLTENGIELGLYNNAFDLANIIRFGIYAGLSLIGVIVLAIILRAADTRDNTLFNALALSVGVFSAIAFWLNLATEIAFFEKAKANGSAVTNSALLSIEGIQADSLVYYSMIASIAALGAVLIYIIICIATRRKRRETECEYPEGEELLEMWKLYDEEDGADYLDEEEEFSLDTIAQNLQIEYPVQQNSEEFKGGFNIVADISAQSEKNSIDSQE